MAQDRLLVVKDGKYEVGKMTNGGKGTDSKKELCESIQSRGQSKSCYYEQVNKKGLKLWEEQKISKLVRKCRNCRMTKQTKLF